MDNYMYYTLQSSKVYVDNSEFGYTPSGVVQYKRTIIHSPTGTCAVWQDSAYVQTLYVVHTDYLGSWVAITNSAATVTNRYSYDAWGRARNVTNWELKPVSITNALTNLNAFQPRFDRGYTGHEHLSGFGLIHMNARVYDPYLQRFLSPDNYIQDMTNAQNYNRYSYCINNPLKYVDPSGNLFLGTSITFGGELLKTAVIGGGLDPTSKKARKNAWKEFDPTASWSKTNKAFKIDKGSFKTDPNKNFWGRSGELVSRYTWQAPQSFIGKNSAQIHNFLGGVKSVDYYGGATVVQSKSEDWGAISLGNVIIGSSSIEANPNNHLFQHEYGHYLQSQSSGYIYLTKFGLPSLISANKNDYWGHTEHWTEQDANRRAYRYFSNHDTEYDGWDDFLNPIYDSNGDPLSNLDDDTGSIIKTKWWEYFILKP